MSDSRGVQKGQAYVGAFRPKDNLTQVKLVVAFRGTENLENWIENLDIAKTDHAMSCKGCKAHSGFVNIWTAFQKPVLAELMKLHSLYPSAKLLVTGHSLGAAVALIAGYSLQYDIGMDVAGVYTYGCPRVGNQAFSDFLDGRGRQQPQPQPQPPGSQLRIATAAPSSEEAATRARAAQQTMAESRRAEAPYAAADATVREHDGVIVAADGPFSPFPYWRITHGRDPVPHLPPRWIGFMHVATEIFFKFDNHTHVVCDGTGEDRECSNRHWVDLSVFDHLHYYGETTGIVAC